MRLPLVRSLGDGERERGRGLVGVQREGEQNSGWSTQGT